MSVPPTRLSLLALALFTGLAGNVIVGTTLRGQTVSNLPQLENPIVVDDGDALPAYSSNGQTVTVEFSTEEVNPYGGDFRYMVNLPENENDQASASWLFQNLEVGTYNVFVTWVPFGSNNPVTQYTLTQQTTNLGTVTINQRTTPAHVTFGGVNWQLIGKYTLENGELRVTSIAGNLFSIIDAVAIQRIDDTQTSSKASSTSTQSSALSSVASSAAQSSTASSATSSAQSAASSFVSASSIPSSPQSASSAQQTSDNYCGDGLISLADGEQCDDGNLKNGDGCSTFCTSDYCGDGIVTPSRGEECDVNTPNCGSCKWLYCGDGIISQSMGEQCDDGNALRGDGCSETCRTETASSARSSSTSSQNSSIGFAGCASGFTCTVREINMQCVQLGFTCAPGEIVATDGACGSNSCDGQCVRCVPASSSSSSVTPQIIPTATLSITEKNIDANETVVFGQSDVPVMQLVARAGNDQDVILRGFSFKAVKGDIHSFSPSVKIDTNNDGIPDTAFNTSKEQNFEPNTPDGVPIKMIEIEPEILIPKGTSMTIDIQAVINDFAMGQAGLQLTEINAIGADDEQEIWELSMNGVCFSGNCRQFITTVEPKTFTIKPAGSLFVTKDIAPIRSHQLLASTLAESIMHLTFRAQDEGMEVADIQLTSLDNDASSVDRLELFIAGNNTPFALATTGACGNSVVPSVINGKNVRTFCANMESRELSVFKGEEVHVIVRPRMKSDADGAIAGQSIRFFIASTPVADEATGQGAIRARGLASSRNILANNGNAVADGEIFIGTNTPNLNADIVSSTNVTVLSKITSITNASTDSDGTSVPAGPSAIGQFTFTAAAHTNAYNGLNDVTLSKLTFNIYAQNIGWNADGFKIYNKEDDSVKGSCTSALQPDPENNNAFYVNCNLDQTTVLHTIESGQSLTLVLEAAILAPQVNSGAASNVRVVLENISSPGWMAYGEKTSHVAWSQEEGGTALYWFDQEATSIPSTRYSNNPTYGSNSSSSRVIVPDLSATITASTLVKQGGIMAYGITVKNNGELVNDPVSVLLDFPGNLIARALPDGCAIVGIRAVRCNLGVIDENTPNRTKTLTIPLSVRPSENPCNTITGVARAIVIALPGESQTANNTSTSFVTQFICSAL